jgi:Protein of unknown function (DUF3617)
MTLLFVARMKYRVTRRFAIAAAALFAAGVLAHAADPLEPGLWKVVTQVDMNGMQGPAETKTRCLKPDDARDLERTFAPEYRVQGAACERMNVAWSGQKLSWRVQCAGPLTMEVAGTYDFDTPRHYTGVVTTLAVMAGREMRTRTTLEAERIGECAKPDDGGQKTQ